MELALIGYAWPKRPKIVFGDSFELRRALWREGYSVDAIPRALAFEIDAPKTSLGNYSIENHFLSIGR